MGTINLKTVAERTGHRLDVPARAVKALLEEALFQIEEALAAGESVRLCRFGIFYSTEQVFDQAYLRRQGVLPDSDDLRIRVNRFRFARGVKRRINGVVSRRVGAP
ncbi:HU family DNA-binding protein [Acidimicrobium ferrooxidans]|nr:HU family DNA-binding protein [Acidimicrobium ferrooxidans]